MPGSVSPFQEIPPARLAAAGGKGAALARLFQAGYPVPPGLVIFPEAFAGDELTPAAWDDLQAGLAPLRRAGSALAVRSSARGEDSAEASFAGAFETVLGVRGDAELRAAIRTVRRSRSAARALAYGAARGAAAAPELAVVVQAMVPAEFSGVLFTADPLTGSRARLAGNFVRGLGEGLVAGRVTGESFTLDARRHRWFGADYRGPAPLARYARRLRRLGLRLEDDLGGPQDIEWAAADGEIFLLQSRPITAAGAAGPAREEWNDSLAADCLWSNVNFGEAVPSVMTPLSWTVLRFIFGQWAVLPRHDAVGNIGGRPYLNLSLYATVLHALGLNRRRILRQLEGLLTLRLPDEAGLPLLPLSRWAVLARLPHLINLRRHEARARRELSAYLAANPERCRALRRDIQNAPTKDALRVLWRDRIEPHVTRSVWYVMASVNHYTGEAKRRQRELEAMVGPDDAGAILSDVRGNGEPGGPGLLASLGPVVGLHRVAGGVMTPEAYLEAYGHRGPDEFELSVPRPAEDPAWLEGELARFRQAPVDVEALLVRRRAAREAAWDRFQSRCPRAARSLGPRLAELARRGWLREAVRSEYTRDRWLVRAFALRAGELTGLQAGAFFLTLDELLALLAGSGTAVARIPGRRAAYERYRALPPYPPVIRGRFDPERWAAVPGRRQDLFDASAPAPLPPAADGVVRGTPAAAGRAEGVVRRLDRPEDGHQLAAGEVLVTVQADIAWTLLFPRAAAIVTDVGAPLSHAAIVARELGLPAVLGCGDATSRLKTGDRVRVDGARGTVELLPPG